MKIVFYGDSITEANKNHADLNDLGDGYVHIFSLKLHLLFPEIPFTFVNLGKAGDRTEELKNRVGEVVAEQPDWVILLGGINDVSCRFTSGIEVSPETFQENYLAVVKAIKETGARLAILQPFVLQSPDKVRYHKFLTPLLDIIQEIAQEYADVYVPLDEYFNGLAKTNEISDYSPDGIHPTHRASRTIADCTIKGIKKFME